MNDFALIHIPEQVYTLNEQLKLLTGRSKRAMAHQAEINALLQQENAELRLRLGVLIRLLVQQGTITPGQFSSALNESKASLDVARTPTVQPAATPPPKLGKLPKPPKPLKSVPPKTL